MLLKEEIPIREEEVQCLLIKETTTNGGRELITMMCKEITNPKEERREIMYRHRARVILVMVLILHRVELMGKADIMAMEQERLMVKDRVMDLIQARPKETCKKNNETTLLVDKHGTTTKGDFEYLM